MRTITIFAALFLLLCSASRTVTGQKPVTDVFTVNINLPFDCLGQDLTGTVTVERTIMNNHMHSKLFGTVTGSSDGLDYQIDMINNIADIRTQDQPVQGAIVFTWPGNYHISRNGKLIGVVHFAFHMTINPDGEYTVYRGDVYEYNCVGGGNL